MQFVRIAGRVYRVKENPKTASAGTTVYLAYSTGPEGVGDLRVFSTLAKAKRHAKYEETSNEDVEGVETFAYAVKVE